MKSFIAAVALASVTFADWVECEIGSDGCDEWGWMYIAPPASEQIGRAFEDFFHGIGNFMEDGVNAEEGMAEVWDEFLCWWGEREPETTCPRREEEDRVYALEEECYMQDGMTFDWESEQCLTYEEECALPNDWCVKTWISDEWGNSWCDWQCDGNLVLTRVTPKRTVSKRGEGRFISEACQKEECALPNDWCVKTWMTDEWGNSWCDWQCDGNLVLTRVTPKRTVSKRGEGRVISEACQKEADPEFCQDIEDIWAQAFADAFADWGVDSSLKRARMQYALKTSKRGEGRVISEACQKEADPEFCQDIEDIWAQAFADAFLDWGVDSSQKRARMQYALKTVDLDIDLIEAAAIAQMSAESQAEVGQFVENVAMDVGVLIEQWGPTLEELGMRQEQRQAEIDAAFMEMLADAVIIDGSSLRDMFGNPENWWGPQEENWEETPNRLRLPARVQRALFKKQEVPAYLHKSLFSLADLEIPETATGVQVSLEFPDDIDMQVQQWISSGMQIVESFDQWAGEQLNSIEDEMEDAARSVVDETVNPIGDALKTAVEGGSISFSLAEKKTAKKSKKHSKKDYSKAAAGATFGAIGLISVAALALTCKGKDQRSHEEALL